MTREEWQRVKRISSEALDVPAREREAFIGRACGLDAALAGEVRSLIESVERASDLFENQPLIARSTLAAGAQLGPYEILGPIGSGAMGEVYRARDARLARDVAIKVLP